MSRQSKTNSAASSAVAIIDPEIHRRAKWRNRINTALILGGLTLLLTVSAWALFGVTGIVWAMVMAMVVSMMTPRVSPAMVLRLFKARAIAEHEAPELFRIVAILAQRADLPAVPKLYYVASSNMNAFAVGRPEDSAITVTDGLVRALDLRQLTGVVAHEVSHIANEDLKVMGLADMVSRLTGTMQTIGIFLILLGFWSGGGTILAAIVLILAPTVGTLLQLALSRSREYDADLGAVQLTGDPVGLASALQTLERKQGSLWESIVLPGGRTPDPSLLRTHPKVEDRVARLLLLSAEPSTQWPQTGTKLQLPSALRPVVQPPHYHLSGLWY